MINAEDTKVEKCLYCGGRVTGVKERKTQGSFLSKSRSEKKQCSRCQRILENREIVLCSSNEVLGWRSR